MKVSKKELEKVKNILVKMGAVEEPPPPYAFSRLRIYDGVVTLYNSGSITFGGKGKEKVKSLITYLLTKEIDTTPRIGCDEAGKGEFVGPLVLACIFADKNCIKKLLELQVKDSKKLSKKRIIELSEEIKKHCNGTFLVLTPEKYNNLYKKYKNVNRMMEEIYLKLIDKLIKKHPAQKVIIDKFSSRIEKLTKEKLKNIEVKVFPKADEKEIVVAAASIVAKAERLKFLQNYSLPEGNLKNKELLEKIPKELHHKFFKLHFKI